MDEILTPKEVQKKYGWSYKTWYRRREECLVSPYKDAIVMESQKRCHVKAKRFEEFLEWKSKQIYNEKFGLVQELIMSKWINNKINEFMGTDFTVRETEILTLSTACTALVAIVFTMFTAVFPNIQENFMKESIYRITWVVVITVILGVTSKMLGIPLDIFILILVVEIMCDNEFRYRKNEKNK